MKIAEAVKLMSKSYLNRIVDSFAKDFSKQSESQARETITKNVKELADTERISTLLRTYDTIYHQQILRRYILESLLEQPEYEAKEDEIIATVQEREKDVLKEAESEECFQFADERSLATLKTVLEVAIQDTQLSGDELRLIRHLREKLSLNRKDQFLLLAQLNHYPKVNGDLHSPSDFNSALLDLQKLGVVFYCNKHDEGAKFVIPEELVPGVKSAIGFELSEAAFGLLLEKLTNTQLREILGAHGVKKGGTKQELITRVQSAEIQPSEGLELLSDHELYTLCKNLPGANVGGTKNEKIQRVIKYFDELVVKDTPIEPDPGERYYDYFVELANRDRKNLLANNVIRKDREMERAFELGTQYLFTEKFGLNLVELSGSDHPDGCILFQKNELFMWDNKSKEKEYTFPQSHVRQFKSYIRESVKRVNCFLVIVPEIADGAEKNAYRLKVESESDTDVSLIRAEDLKWIAENWCEYASNDDFNLEIFNITGILMRDDLVNRMELFLQ